MTSCKNKKGVIVGADRAIEWLLPWWWKHYSYYNTFPVAFFDFGMSEKKKEWCKKRGQLIDLSSPKIGIIPKESLSEETVQSWEKKYAPKVWRSREAWFKKPQACLQSPFDLTLWLDIDCEVCGSLQPLFDSLLPSSKIAMVPDISAPEKLLNSGVIVFRKNEEVLHQWLDACIEQNGNFMGDQEVFSHLVLQKRVVVQELPYFYNWRMVFGFHPAALIVHWVGTWGKEYIRKFGGMHVLSRK